MRALGLVFAASTVILSAQIAPVPADRLELVTGETQIASTEQQRSPLVTLMDKAVVNHSLHMRGDNPFNIQVSFTAAASTLYPATQGTLEESWLSGQIWQWSTTMGNYADVRVGTAAAVYAQNTAPMPMRLKTLREAIFAPILTNGRPYTLRSASVSWNGLPLTCVLTSGAQAEQKSAQGRQWYEHEFCIDPATATLRIQSAAPGIYVVFDYANGHKFHNHLIPGKITVIENGVVTVEAQITSMTDADATNLSIYTPTAQMVSQGTAPVSAGPERFPLIWPSHSAGSPIQPVIVHATMDQTGKILEIEALQSNSNTEEALAAVMKQNFGGPPVAAGASPWLREAFINVQLRNVQFPAKRTALLN